MAAFLLVANTEKEFKVLQALEVIRLQCSTLHKEFVLPGYRLYLFPKQIPGYQNHIVKPDSSIFFTGSPFIPGKPVSALKSGNFTPSDLSGMYFILKSDGFRLKFSIDESGLYSIYHSSSGSVISSSFLALCTGLSGLTVDRDAAVENLLTGTLIGPETIFKEIKRFESSAPFTFKNLTFEPVISRRFKTYSIRNRKDSLVAQIDSLDAWFDGFRPVASELGVSAGITGGLDSRLLLALCKRHLDHDKVRFHSHLRKSQDKDYLFGKAVCEKAGLQFKTVPVTDAFDISDDNSAAVFNEGMLFNDGQVRTHSFWFEEFNTSRYARLIMGDKLMGINGIGGEQYRNMERLLLPWRNNHAWIYSDMIARISGTNGASRKLINDLNDKLTNKIELRLGPATKGRIDLLYIKRFMNEVYNPANRALRACHENKQSYFLSPFAESALSFTAYDAVGHLGSSINYEAEMIRMIDPDVASVGSVYGFSFNKKEPLMSSLPRVIINNFTPGALGTRMLAAYGTGRTTRWTDIQNSNQYFSRCVNAIRDISLPVNTDKLLGRTDIGPLVFAMGHLLISFGNKIKGQ